MNEFRQALDSYLAGRIELAAAEQALNLSLARAPHMAAAHGAYLEALYRSSRLTGEIYSSLVQVIRNFQQTHGRVSVTAVAAEAAADRTQFRPPKAATPTVPPSAVSPSAVSPSAVPPPAAEAAADKTQFRAPPGVTNTGAVTTGATNTGLTGSSRLTASSSWSNPSRWAAGEAQPLVSGSIVKDRFVLEEELGRGGMGIVFKARDLRKEEAQDRNPYVALKLLNEEFKRHPESLKALQREARKAQNLAHPNVVTVYDFDRDGANVYMVMELLEGEPLDRIIRSARDTGIELKESLRITRDVCRAMAYAHEQGIVHSDFKPANAFRTREGVVKVFDFGIARAAKVSDKAAGTTTLFDPGTLGALTPAYASCEMLEGLEPDPRDDIYAIACVTYELLTGKHPFDRMSAVEARKRKLLPKAPPGLSRAQWRSLQRGLAFSRNDRSGSALEFLNGVLPPKRSPTVFIGAGAAGVAVVVIAAVVIPGQITRHREQSRIAALATGLESNIKPLLPELRDMQPAQRNAILANDEVRTGLLRYFEAQINSAVDTSKGHYDFPRAEALAADLRSFYPDSSAVRDVTDRLLARKNEEIKRQSDRFDHDLARGLLIKAQGPESIEVVLGIVRTIDPHHPLLNDPRLPGAYAEQTRIALQRSNSTLARALIADGLKISPDDAALRDLRDETQSAAEAAQRSARVAQLERSLGALLAQHATLDDYGARRTDIAELRSNAAHSPVLARVQDSLQRDVAREVQRLSGVHKYDDAQKFLAQYADLGSPAFVESYRQQINASRAAFQTQLAHLADSITEAIRQRRLGVSVRGSAEQHLAEFASAGADPEQLSAARDQIAQGYVRLAAEARQRANWSESRRLLAGATALKPSTAVAAVIQQAAREGDETERLAKAQLDTAQRQQLAAQREREENELRAQLTVGLSKLKLSIADARQLGGVADQLIDRGAKDPLVVNAKHDLQMRLVQSVSVLKDTRGIDDALKFATQAVTVFPDSPILRQTLEGLRSAATARLAQQRDAAILEIKSQIDTLIQGHKPDTAWDAALKRQVQKLGAYLPPGDPYFASVKARTAGAYLAHARELRQAQRFAEAGRMLDRAKEYAPQSAEMAAEDKLLANARAQQAADAKQRERAAQIEALEQKLIDQARANEVTEAQASLAQLRANLPVTDVFTTKDAPEAIARSYLRLAATAAKEGRLENAVGLIDRGRALAPALNELTTARQRYVRYAALEHSITSDPFPDAAAIRRELDQLFRLEPTETALEKQHLAHELIDRIRTAGADRTAASFAWVDRLTRTARDIFPDDPAVAALIGTTAPAAAARPQSQAAATSSSTQPSPPVTAGGTSGVAANAGAANVGAAGSATPPAASTTGDSRKQESTAAALSSNQSSGAASTGATPAPATGAAAAVPAVQCSPALAGYGRRKQGICFDSFDGGRGPDLVVIPPVSAGGQPFAIGRTEVSNAEYSQFCARVGHCTVSGLPANPVTSISLADAQRYMDWLSQVTGATYRLPTDSEWTQAANAQGGATDRSSVNCVIQFGGKQVRGFSLDTVLSGTPNAWGVYNYAGNAQEWVRSGSSVSARGGAYSDNVSQCTPATSRPHSGSADPITGFRVLREIKSGS